MSKIKIYSPTKKRKPSFLKNSKAPSNSLLSKGTSKQEISLSNTVQLLLPGEKILHNDRTILEGHELDIYVPSRHLAIEFDGLYWHSSAKGKDRFYHLQKSVECEKKGIRLLHVWSNDWELRKPLVIDTIKRACGLCDKIPASECQIKELSVKEGKTFFDAYHFSGNDDTATHYYGLEYMDVTIMAVSMKQDSILRIAERKGYQVIQGLGALVSLYNVRPLWAECDRRYYDNQMFKEAGFKEKYPTNPEPYYTKDYVKVIKGSELQNLDESRMLKSGYDIIYDCGKRRFLLS